jgi:phosphoglycerol transferase
LKALSLQKLWGLLPLGIGLWAASGVFGILPQIMQDEYIYSSQARNLPFSEHRFANYLFSWVMGGTKFCGAEFYGCVKGINSAVFLIGVFFTLLIASRYLSFYWAVFVASVTALSPLAIQVSFFMPETMYFTVMTISIWLALKVSDNSFWWLWGAVGVSLGLAALVKPHAIFLVPAFVVFAFLIDFRKHNSNWLRAISSGAAVAIGFLVAKLGLGFAFAGERGLRFFGGYGSPVDRISAVVDGGASEGNGSNSVIEIFFSVLASHLAGHIAVLALLAGIPILLALRVSFRILKTREKIGEASGFLLLVSLVTLSMLTLVPTFEAYVSAGGDDHSLRLILRYYEFLIPIFLVAAMLLPRFVEPGKLVRYVQAILVSVLSLVFTVAYPALIDTKFADSSFLPGFEGNPIPFLVSGVVVSVASIYWAINPDKGALVLSRVALPSILIISMLLSQNLLVTTSSQPAYFDFAGKQAREILKDVPGEDIAVIGQKRTEVFTVMFWIDKAPIDDEIVFGESFELAEVSDRTHAVVLGDVKIPGTYSVLQAGDGYQVIEMFR